MTSTLTFDAGVLSRGWLATAIAAGADEELPVLYGTLLIESYSDGVRLTATDRYMLLSTWISATGRDPESERGLDEAPDDATIVRDPDGRGKALLGYLRKLAAKAAKDEEPAPTVALHIGVPADEGNEVGFPGMELEQVVIDYPDHEKLALPIVQGVFPSYRSLLVGHSPAETTELALGGDLVARLGQVAKAAGGYIHWTLAGTRGLVAVEIVAPLTAPTIRGGVMPIGIAVDEAAA